MGSPAGPSGEPERRDNETQHEVILTRGYWVADTACTQALWQAVMGENPSHFKGPRRPVENVTWDECQEFLSRINQARSELELRLLTEAEWEYACRAGTSTPFSFGLNVTTDQVNFNGNYPYAGGPTGKYREQTVDVGSLPPNAWGLHEMHGNVWEWCGDWYGEYASGPVVNPTGPETGHSRVLRGGSWYYIAGIARSAYRSHYPPGDRYRYIGFRFARGHQ
jgi:formylglycine-generating enzyme required for sulfatase activity